MKENEKYSNKDLTITWNSTKCIHAAECVKALPQVYKPKEKPWIHMEHATSQELRSQIHKCPSGALTYHDHN
jgi:uncharacterized Fe-S cluster protein YjdI